MRKNKIVTTERAILINNRVPELPWEIVAVDLFTIPKKDQNLKSTTSAEVKSEIKKWFLVHGVPEIV